MAVKNTPIAIQARRDHDAADHRMAVVASLQGTSGMFPRKGVMAGWGSEFAVAPGSGLSVVVGSGLMVLPAPVAAEGGWIVPNDSDMTVGLAAAHPSNPRIDLLIVRVADSFYYPGGDDLAAIEPVTGIPASSPVAPTVPNASGAYQVLRQIAVGANATVLSTSNITLPAGGVPFTSAGGGRQDWTMSAASSDSLTAWSQVNMRGGRSLVSGWATAFGFVYNGDNGPTFGTSGANTYVTLPYASTALGNRDLVGTWTYGTDTGALVAAGVLRYNAALGRAGLWKDGAATPFQLVTSYQYELSCTFHYPA